MTSPENTNKRICVGKISSSHGVKGLVKIAPFCEDTSLLNGILYTSESGGETLNIALKNSVGKYILAQIEGISTPEQAKTLKCSLYVSRETLPEITNDGEFYIEDLVGISVVNGDNVAIGSIIAVQNYGAGDLLEIKPKSGESYFIPFQDEYVTDINIENKTIVIKNAQNFIIK